MKTKLILPALLTLCAATAVPAQTTTEQRVETKTVVVTGGGAGSPDLLPHLSRALPAGPRRFLGVATKSVSEELRAKFDLPAGMYLEVAFVEPGSPAEKAGVRKGDVLGRLNDQMIANVDQLRALLSLQKKGDTVTLVVLRDGQWQNLQATLDERQAAAPGADLVMEHLDDVLKGMPDATPIGRHVIVRSTGGSTRAAPNAAVITTATPGGVVMKKSSLAVMKHVTDDETLTLTETNGIQQLEVVKKDGTVVFKGPVTTEEERRALPAEIIRKLELLESNRLAPRTGNVDLQ